MINFKLKKSKKYILIANFYRYVQEQVLVDKYDLTWYTYKEVWSMFSLKDKDLQDIYEQMDFLPKDIIKKMPF